ncbi:CNP1-like family protein [Variovorax sp. HW608]|uniref:CNP1-like family protein n=1 Tax=Variovorax sp. HW608 TaxID=1034889 RepID=UPI0008202306|nr:CNP1-like family protein [Variovorax sp. HW608]SCK45178.1 CNP1-like family protein [Variovorax sp. HW608]
MSLPRQATRFLLRASGSAVLACVLGASGLAHAELFGDSDWKESEAPPPPAFSQDKLVDIEMPRYSSLKFGVDPNTIKVTGDGVVRYVIVAMNKEGGGFNAFYEGVHCATDEYKTYARFTSGGSWEAVQAPEWKRIGDRTSRYTQALANQGLCRGHAPRASVGEMIRFLKTPIREVE